MSMNPLSGIVGLFFLATLMPVSAQSTSANILQHPKDQIALQLGAIQMGYQVPFTLGGNLSTQKMQEAANALVMGRNALDATAAKPAAKVQGVINSPAVDTVEYRDQLYSAVEYVVTSPAAGAIRGIVTLEGGKKVAAVARIVAPPNSWTVPVPYALEARSSADVQALRDELVAAGVLSGEGGGSAMAGMVIVQGGTLPIGSELAGQQVATFQIGKYEVTWSEWQEVKDWAVANGYEDMADVGSGNAASHPVQSVSWYDVVKWCNAKSEKEGLVPVYQASGGFYRTGEFGPNGSSAVTTNATANGYRLPTEAEWEWAARGGVSSQGNTYSGSNDLNSVAWTNQNSSGGTKTVGTKAANELGIYDMSGNIWEWCEDFVSGFYRRIRGGSYQSDADYAAVALRDNYSQPDLPYSFYGFRLARSSGN